MKIDFNALIAEVKKHPKARIDWKGDTEIKIGLKWGTAFIKVWQWYGVPAEVRCEFIKTKEHREVLRIVLDELDRQEREG